MTQQQRVFIVHGWESSPEHEWIPWLKGELEGKGFEVIAPAMPDPAIPRIDTWTAALADAVGTIRPSDLFVGHSVGCQAVLRYLAAAPADSSVCGMLFVAGWFFLQGIETPEEAQVARPWLETPIDLERVRTMGPSIALFSDDDPYVELASNRRVFEERLGSRIVVEHGRGHFSEVHGNVRELPAACDAVLALSSLA